MGSKSPYKQEKELKPRTITSTYGDGTMGGAINKANSNSDFGYATSERKDNGEIATTMRLSPSLQPSRVAAEQGLATNLEYLNRSPEQSYQSMRDGQDPYYNIASRNSQDSYDKAMANSALAANRSGLNNSTTYGASIGQLNNDLSRQQNENLFNALKYGGDIARSNIGTQTGALTSLANLLYPLGQQSNSNLLAALTQQDAINMFNAQQLAQTDQLNSGIRLQNAARKAAEREATGKMIGDGLQMAAVIAGQVAGIPAPITNASISNQRSFVPASMGGTSSQVNPEDLNAANADGLAGVGDFEASSGAFV